MYLLIETLKKIRHKCIYYTIHSWDFIETFSATTFANMLILFASSPNLLTPQIWTIPSFWRFILMANSIVWTRFKSIQTNVQKQPVGPPFAPLSIALMSTYGLSFCHRSLSILI